MNKILIWLLVLCVAVIAYTYAIVPLLAALALPHLVTTIILCVLVLAFCFWTLRWFGVLSGDTRL